MTISPFRNKTGDLGTVSTQLEQNPVGSLWWAVSKELPSQPGRVVYRQPRARRIGPEWGTRGG